MAKKWHPVEKKLDTKGLWKRAASSTIRANRVQAKVNEFVDSTKQAIHRNDSGERADLERLTTALMCGDVPKLHTLQKNGRAALDIMLEQVHGLYPIHITCGNMHRKAQRRQLGICLQWLLDYQKVNIEATTSNSRTVLHIVANTMDCDDLWPVLLLLARGADPLVRTNAGDRASDYAKLQRNKEVASLLLEAESHVNPIQFAQNHPALPKHMLPKVIKENYHLSAAFLAGLEDEESDEKFQAPPIAHRTNQSLSSAEDSWEGGASITEDAAKEQAIEPESTRFTLRDLTQTTDNSEDLQQPEQEECLATRIATLLAKKSAAKNWEPHPGLRVVQRTKAAIAKEQLEFEREEKTTRFIATLRERTRVSASAKHAFR